MSEQPTVQERYEIAINPTLPYKKSGEKGQFLKSLIIIKEMVEDGYAWWAIREHISRVLRNLFK